MAHDRATGGQPASHPLEQVINHRKLVAAIFPRSVTAAMTDVPAVTVVDNQEMFHCAASQGMLFTVVELIADGRFSHDLPDRFGRTPLHWAAEQGRCNVVSLLLRKGASVDPRSQRKATPIMLAASRGHDEVVGVLLYFGAGESDRRPLNRHFHGIEHWRSTALHCAAAGGHLAVVRSLVNAGFDKGKHDGAGLTPPELSARATHPMSLEITHMLLPSDMGGKLLYDYVNVQDVAMVCGLVVGGAFLDWQDGTGETPLLRAVEFHHVGISKVLVLAGADPNIRDHQGVSPLHIAAISGRGEMVADLLKAGADLEPRMIGGFCPLHLAVRENRVNVVSLLLNAGASIELSNGFFGQTPLSWACKLCLAPIVRVLVEAGADIESRSSAGLTPLHWACRFIDAESVEVLLNAGADPGVVDQAAADEVAKSPCSSGMIASRPVAMDVIGLGCPLGDIDSSSPSIGGSVVLADRRLDLVSVRRIELALQGAKQERSWHRRGWLVILVNRWVAMGVPGVQDERAAGCRGCLSVFHPAMVQSRYVDTGVKQLPCAHQKGASGYHVNACTNSDSPNSHRPQEKSSSGQDMLGNRPRTVRRVGMTTRSASRRQEQARQPRCDNGAQANVAVYLPELVDALLGITTIEVGVFRRVVMFL